MPICSSCTAELRPEWKFCITCGTQVASAASPAEPDADDALEVPASRFRTAAAYYAPLAFSIACFVAAGAVVTWLAVNVWF